MSTITYLRNRLFPPLPLEFLTIRHGESTRNLALGKRTHFETEKELELYSDPDPEIGLTDEGISQARKLGKFLRKTNLIPDVIIHSGYRRTIETATNALDAYSNYAEIPFEENDDFCERINGYSEFIIGPAFRDHFPWNDRYWKSVGPYRAQPIGGESLFELRRGRVRHGLRDIMRKHRGKVVVLFCHGRIKQCIHMEMKKMSHRESHRFCQESKAPGNVSVSRYSFNPSSGEMDTLCYAENVIDSDTDSDQP